MRRLHNRKFPLASGLELAFNARVNLPRSRAALPMLKAAREKAGSKLRWWIDATLQEIERQPAKK